MPTLLRMSVRELKARLGQSYRNGGNGHSAMPVQSRQGRGSPRSTRAGCQRRASPAFGRADLP